MSSAANGPRLPSIPASVHTASLAGPAVLSPSAPNTTPPPTLPSRPVLTPSTQAIASAASGSAISRLPPPCANLHMIYIYAMRTLYLCAMYLSLGQINQFQSFSRLSFHITINLDYLVLTSNTRFSTTLLLIDPISPLHLAHETDHAQPLLRPAESQPHIIFSQLGIFPFSHILIQITTADLPAQPAATTATAPELSHAAPFRHSAIATLLCHLRHPNNRM